MNSTEPNAEWFAIKAKSNSEQLARLHYERQGLQAYLPLMRVTRKHARRIEQVMRPVFPGYLFLCLAPQERNWTAIASTRGAVGPVHFGGTYVPVPQWVISGLRQKENDQGVIPMGRLEQHLFAPGSEVEVRMGDVTAKGILCSFRGEENVLVLLDFLKRRVSVQVPLDMISRA